MDLHPILVHFPVALLLLYGIFELVSVRKLMAKPYWFYIKAILVIFGALGAIVSAMTGEEGVHYGEHIALIDAHANFAGATVVLSIFIALVYLVAWFARDKFQLFAWKFLANRGAMIPLSIAMIVVILITGGLGGAIVYGTDFDPLMKPIFQLLGVY